jgi:hypothetical protein
MAWPLSMGAGLVTCFARTPAEAVALLEDAVTAMQARAERLSGVTRQHTRPWVSRWSWSWSMNWPRSPRI